MNGMTFAGKPRCDLVLCGQGVATRPRYVGTSCSDGFDEDGGLLGHVKATGDAHPSEGFGSLGFVLEFGQDGHSSTSPVNQQGALVGQADVANGVVATFVQVIHERLNGRPLLNSIVRPRQSPLVRESKDRRVS